MSSAPKKGIMSNLMKKRQESQKNKGDIKKQIIKELMAMPMNIQKNKNKQSKNGIEEDELQQETNNNNQNDSNTNIEAKGRQLQNGQRLGMEGKLSSYLIQQQGENQFYDQECIQADKELQNVKQGEIPYSNKIKKVNGIMQRLSASVADLKNRYSEIEIAEILSKKRNKRKEAEARAFVKGQQQKKKVVVKKFQQIKQKQLDKKTEQEQRRLKQEQKQKQKKIKQLKNELQQKKKEKQNQKKAEAQKQQKVKQFISKMKHQLPLYLIYEQKFEKHEQKQKQLEIAFLNKRRQKFKPIEYEELITHRKLQEEKERDASKVKQQEKIQKNQEIAQQNLKLLEKIYRGKNYERVQQEEEERQRLKLRAKQKRERLLKYENYVRENFKPEAKEQEEDQTAIIDQKQKQSSNQEDQDGEEHQKQQKFPQYRKVKRYKFLQGRSVGQIIETVKMPLSQKLQRRMGDNYLQHVYSLPKRKVPKQGLSLNLSQQKQTQSAKSRMVQIPHLPRPKYPKVKISQNPNRQQISNLIISLKNRDNQLQIKKKNLSKLPDCTTENVRNQISDNIIQNIQRKLSLLTQL